MTAQDGSRNAVNVNAKTKCAGSGNAVNVNAMSVSKPDALRNAETVNAGSRKRENGIAGKSGSLNENASNTNAENVSRIITSVTDSNMSAGKRRDGTKKPLTNFSEDFSSDERRFLS